MKLFRRNKKDQREPMPTVDEAEAIYQDHPNECRASICPCGRPVEVITEYYLDSFKVAEFRTCQAHPGAKGWERAKDWYARPLHARPDRCVGCGVARFCHGRNISLSGREEWVCQIPPG